MRTGDAVVTKIILLLAFIVGSQHAIAELCPAWAPSERVGSLNPKLINEASGLAISRAFPGRFYHVNDSGDGPNLYVTKADGSGEQTVKIGSFVPLDVEDLSLGSFGDKKNCLFIADIGDNKEARPDITVIVIEETPKVTGKAEPLAKLQLKYPDHPHNAEGIAIHPNGDLYILTKEMNMAKKQPLPAQLFRLKKKDMTSSTPAVKTLEKVGTFDLPKILKDQDIWGQIVTGFDISPDGTRFLILTYQLVLEVQMDLSKEIKPTEAWVLGSTYTKFTTVELPQQEAVAYGETDQSLFYDSELAKDMQDVPLYRSVCEHPPKASK
jgi:hypothetical protein